MGVGDGLGHGDLAVALGPAERGHRTPRAPRRTLGSSGTDEGYSASAVSTAQRPDPPGPTYELPSRGESARPNDRRVRRPRRGGIERRRWSAGGRLRSGPAAPGCGSRSRAASSAVARTQWSVAMPDHVDRGRRRASRSQAASPMPPGSRPSKPEYAAACSPLSKTASIAVGVQGRVELRARRCRRRSAPARCRRSPAGRRSGRPGRCGGPWSRRRGRTASGRRPVRGDRGGDRRRRRRPASEPPSQKSFCTSTMISALGSWTSPRRESARCGIAGSPRGELETLPRDRRSGAAAQVLARLGQLGRSPTALAAARSAAPQQPVVRAGAGGVALRTRRPPRSRCRWACAGAPRSCGRRWWPCAPLRFTTGRRPPRPACRPGRRWARRSR